VRVESEDEEVGEGYCGKGEEREEEEVMEFGRGFAPDFSVFTEG